MGINSSTDRKLPVGQHLDELHRVIRRAALIFLIAAALTSLWVESILNGWAPSQAPGGALSVYGPYDWVEMRFTAVFIIASVVTLPLVSLDLRAFARPGLLPSERRWLDTFLLVNVISIPAILHWVWYQMIPAYAQLGLELDRMEGVAAHFDAADIFALASGLSWILILAYMTTLFLSLSRLFGLVEDGQSRFRNRALAICGGLLVLTLPEVFEGVRVLIAVCVMIVAEAISRTTPTGPLGPRISSLREIRSDRGIERVLLLDCSCEGACPKVHSDWVGHGINVIHSNALCLDPLAQDQILETARAAGVTLLTVTGCDGRPIPSPLSESLIEAGTLIEGLGWLDEPQSAMPAWRRQSLQFYSSQFSRANADSFEPPN